MICRRLFGFVGVRWVLWKVVHWKLYQDRETRAAVFNELLFLEKVAAVVLGLLFAYCAILGWWNLRRLRKVHGGKEKHDETRPHKLTQTITYITNYGTFQLQMNLDEKLVNSNPEADAVGTRTLFFRFISSAWIELFVNVRSSLFAFLLILIKYLTRPYAPIPSMCWRSNTVTFRCICVARKRRSILWGLELVSVRLQIWLIKVAYCVL